MQCTLAARLGISCLLLLCCGMTGIEYCRSTSELLGRSLAFGLRPVHSMVRTLPCLSSRGWFCSRQLCGLCLTSLVVGRARRACRHRRQRGDLSGYQGRCWLGTDGAPGTRDTIPPAHSGCRLSPPFDEVPCCSCNTLRWLNLQSPCGEHPCIEHRVALCHRWDTLPLVYPAEPFAPDPLALAWWCSVVLAGHGNEHTGLVVRWSHLVVSGTPCGLGVLVARK